MKISDFIDSKARKYGKNKVIKFILRPFYTYGYKLLRNSISKRKRRRQIKKYGTEALAKFNDVLTKNGFRYSLAFGSCLGAIREHGFIKHDLDIDTWMWYEDFDEKLYDLLAEEGINRLYNYTVENGNLGMLDTFVYHGFHIDIFYIYPALKGREYPYCCDFPNFPDCANQTECILKYGGVLPRRIELPFLKQTTLVSFEGISLPIEINAHDILRMRYGNDYMIPNPKWTNGANTNIIEWTAHVGKLKIFS